LCMATPIDLVDIERDDEKEQKRDLSDAPGA
jgi:hypothetical protein